MQLPALVCSSLLTLAQAQQYELQAHFPGATFLDNFDFVCPVAISLAQPSASITDFHQSQYTSWDPTYGYVHYVDRATAESKGMISYTPDTTRWGVETTEILDPSANLGRLSLRLMSKQSWTHGLFVLDLKHMPHNACGSWPAFWTVGSGVWPSTGEIDIVEFTNNGPRNLMALHTLPGCSIAGAGMTGQLDYNECNQADAYTGCAIRSKEEHGSGAQFNVIGGGVYAMEWTARWVRVWFFPRYAVPESIANAGDSTPPDTSTFGVPVANFEGSCDFDQFLFNHTMIFNVDFCGTYAGNVFGLQGCPMTDPTNAWKSCVQYVALNPSAFTDVYWEVNYLKVYQDTSGWVPPSSTLSSIIPAASTSSVSKLTSNAQGRPTTPTMSLAGTTPTDISGSFSATSSVLSVLSSFSTRSQASVLSSLAAEPTLPYSTPTPGLPFTSTVSPAPPPPASSTPSPTTLMTSIPPPAPELVTLVTVVQTVTVYDPPFGHDGKAHQRLHHRRRAHAFAEHLRRQETSPIPEQQPTPAPTTPSSPTAINTHGECTFSIPHSTATTDYTCTFTKLGLLPGQPSPTIYTNRMTFSTALPPDEGLTMLTFLTIETVSVQTATLEGDALGVTFTAVTGSFTPSANSVKETVVTGSPDPAVATPAGGIS